MKKTNIENLSNLLMPTITAILTLSYLITFPVVKTMITLLVLK